jgi:glycosyltransferase involved in cell wall biosynthesis
MEVLSRFASRIMLIRQQNCGPAAARNKGVVASRSEFIAFLDADDYWEQGFLEACQSFLSAEPKAAAVSTGFRINLPSGKAAIGPPWLLRNPAKRRPFVVDDFFSFWVEEDHIRTGSCLIRRDVLLQAGLMNPNLRTAEDLELWALLSTYGKWGFIPVVLWVGDSDVVAAEQGWLAKYKTRWTDCPSMDEWTRRILPRLAPADWVGFRKVCGRIAASFARNAVLARKFHQARGLVNDYASTWPNSFMASLLRVGTRLGYWGFVLAGLPIIAREYQKALFLEFHRKRL